MRKKVTGFRGNGAVGFGKDAVLSGTDPEAELINSRGRMVSASSVGLRCGANEEIGADGAGTPAELRPKPGKPETVVANIKKILKRFARRFPGYKLSVEGNQTAIGAHIHVSIKDRHITNDQAEAITRVIDDFLGRVVINAMAGQARLYSGYNRLTAFRMQSYNSTTTGFEYRSCPAGIMLNPKLFHLCLKIVRLTTWTMFTKKRFSYEAPVPTAADYLKVCHMNREQYDTFMQLVGEYAGADKNLLPAWGVREREVTERPARAAAQQPTSNWVVTAQFADDWSATLQATIDRAISQLHPIHRNVSLRLFGLRADRGNVCAGITIPSMGIISHSNAGMRNGTFAIGLPFAFRNGDMAESVTTEVINALREVVRYYDRPQF